MMCLLYIMLPKQPEIYVSERVDFGTYRQQWHTGMITARVDGNDVFVVYNVTKAARDICIRESRPVLIKALTYRYDNCKGRWQ